MYTGVHSDVSQESGCTSKEQATCFKDKKVFDTLEMLLDCFIQHHIAFDCGIQFDNKNNVDAIVIKILCTINTQNC